MDDIKHTKQQAAEEDIARLLIEAKDQPESFNRLYELYAVPVYRYIFIRVKHKQTAEDLAQAVFIKAYKSLANYRYTGKSPLAWFFTIARNCVIDHFRSSGRAQIDSDDALAKIPSIHDFAGDLDKQAAIAGIKNLITNLSPDQQEVLILKFVNDFTNAEISQIVGKSEEAIRQLQSRGIKSLKKMVGDTINNGLRVVWWWFMSDEILQQVVKMLDQGKSPAQILAMLGNDREITEALKLIDAITTQGKTILPDPGFREIIWKIVQKAPKPRLSLADRIKEFFPARMKIALTGILALAAIVLILVPKITAPRPTTSPLSGNENINNAISGIIADYTGDSQITSAQDNDLNEASQSYSSLNLNDVYNENTF